MEVLLGEDKAAAKFVIGKTSASGEHVGERSWLSWIIVGRTLMNLDEFITKE